MMSMRMFGLAAVAAMTLSALGVGTASATELYGSGTTLGVGTEIIASSANSGSLASTSEEPIATCAGVGFGAGISNAGSSSSTVSGPAAIAFAGCSVTVDESKNGSFEVHHISSTTNGTLTGTGFFFTVHSPFVGACNYGLGEGSVDLGTLTGSTSGNAKIDMNAIVTEQAPKRILCPDTTRWIANYEVTSPTKLTVEAS